MQSPAKPPKHKRDTGVHAQLKALGLRTCNSEQQPARAVFEAEAVNRLYKHEISALFGILCRDQGTVLDRNDPLLFDKDLDKLLIEFGPLIWPRLGEGDRKHLHEAQAGTTYDTNLSYPRDAAVLKQRLRNLILAKRISSATDIQALIEKRHKDANLKVSKSARRSVTTKPKKQASVGDTSLLQVSQKSPYRSNTDASDGSESEDSVIGTTTRRRAFESASSSTDFRSVELRIYRKTAPSHTSTLGPVFPYGPMFLTSECTTSHDCFDRVCQHVGTDCNFMVFQLAEDMSLKGSMRLDRGSADAEKIFQGVLGIFRKARKFPGEPQYRSVEVEVGLDMPLES